MTNYPPGAERQLHDIEALQDRIEKRKETIKQALAAHYKKAMAERDSIRMQRADGTLCNFWPHTELLDYVPDTLLLRAMSWWSMGEELMFALEINRAMGEAFKAMIEAHADLETNKEFLDE